MVGGFKDSDGVFHPIDRSPLGKTGLSVREALPKEKQEDKKRQSDRLGKFAQGRAKEFAKVLPPIIKKGAKITGKAVVAGAKEAITKAGVAKAKRAEKGFKEQEFVEHLDEQIDEILDAPSSDSSKFRKLQRFGILNRNLLSKHQLKIVNDTLKELDERIKKRREGEKVQTGGLTMPREEGIVPIEKVGTGEFEKLPEPIKEQIKTEVAGE